MKKYPKYKEINIEYLSNLPDNWELWKFKRLTNILTCGYAATPQYVDENVGVAFLSAQNVKPGRIVLDKFSYITKELHSELTKNKKTKNGDVLIARVGGEGNIGDAAIVDVDFEFSVYVSLAHVRTRKNLNNKFLVYFFQSDYAKLLSKIETQVGGGVGNLNVKDMERYKIPIPPLPEQRAIVQFLDYKTGQIDRFIASRQKQIELLKEQKAAIINKAVTKGINPNAKMKDSRVPWLDVVPEHWEIKKIKHIKAHIKNSFVDGPFGSNLKSEHYNENGNVLVIESGFITSGEFVISSFKKITDEHFETIKRSECKTGDIIIAKIGFNYGMSGILPDLKSRSVVSGNSLKLTVNEKENITEYIHNLLLYLKKEGAFELIVNETAQPALSLGKLNNVTIAIPNKLEQQEILDFINREASTIINLISKYQKQIDLMHEYRTSLISQAVTGKIDVRDWQLKNQQIV